MFSPRKSRRRWQWRPPLTFLVLLLASARCAGDSDSITNSRGLVPDLASASKHASNARPLASVVWNGVTRGAIARNRPSQNAALRQFAYVTLAQHVAAEAVSRGEGEGGRGRRAALRGAIAGAAVPVLTHLYPLDAALFDSVARAEEASLQPGQQKEFRKAELIGRQLGGKVVALAQTDGFDLPFTGPIPTGPDKWTSLAVPPAPPLLPRMGEMRPFYMERGDQFRPPPPPAFGSPAYLEGLGEVRRISDTRTSVQDSIAKFWALPTGSLVIGYWNTVALELIAQHGLREREAAHALALMNTAALDANIASHDAKYTYWFIRPSGADPAIRLAIGLPNHPSYPSNHATISGTIANVLSVLFPEDREVLQAQAHEAGLSRIYGGIHYRFDMDAGFEIARKVSELAVRLDKRRALERVLR